MSERAPVESQQPGRYSPALLVRGRPVPPAGWTDRLPRRPGPRRTCAGPGSVPDPAPPDARRLRPRPAPATPSRRPDRRAIRIRTATRGRAPVAGVGHPFPV